MNCYVYFKAKVENENAIMHAEHVLHSHLQLKYRLDMSLQRRPEPENALHTWMEVYKDIPANFEEVLANAVQQTTLSDLQYSERHVEYFLNVEACA